MVTHTCSQAAMCMPEREAMTVCFLMELMETVGD